MNRKLGAVVVRVVVLLILVGGALAQSTVLEGTFDANKVSYAASDELAASVLSPAFTDVPGMVRFFDVGSGEAVKVDFSAAIAGQSDKPLTIRMLFDENATLTVEPTEIRITPSATLTQYSATFVLPLENGLGPGGHNVRIQWRSGHTSRVVSSHRILTIQHN